MAKKKKTQRDKGEVQRTNKESGCHQMQEGQAECHIHTGETELSSSGFMVTFSLGCKFDLRRFLSFLSNVVYMKQLKS